MKQNTSAMTLRQQTVSRMITLGLLINYRVYMNNIEKQSELVAYIKTLDNVREVNQSEQAAKTLGSINRIVSYVSVAVIVILLLIAVFDQQYHFRWYYSS